MSKILHLSTGGTIDGHVPEYPEIKKAKDIFGDISNLNNYIVETFKIHSDYSSKEICSKDSRDITDEDRKKLTQTIEKAYTINKIDKFLVTHGTFTMPETGKYLLLNIDKSILKKISVVITGAMFPLNVVGSDALLTVGASISSLLNTQNPLGVIICMHGKNWNPEKVKKDTQNLIFTSE